MIMLLISLQSFKHGKKTTVLNVASLVEQLLMLFVSMVAGCLLLYSWTSIDATDHMLLTSWTAIDATGHMLLTSWTAIDAADHMLLTAYSY